MRPSTLLPAFLTLLTLSSASPEPQVAAGGGDAATTLAATQYPIVTTVASLMTVGGTTTTTYIVYTQTFAATALGSYVLFKSISYIPAVFHFVRMGVFSQGLFLDLRFILDLWSVVSNWVIIANYCLIDGLSVRHHYLDR